MEVENITVKVELGPWAVHAVAVLTDRGSRTKEGAAGAAAALCRELQTALQDSVDAGMLVGVGVGGNGHQGAVEGRYNNGAPRKHQPGAKADSRAFLFRA